MPVHDHAEHKGHAHDNHDHGGEGGGHSDHGHSHGGHGHSHAPANFDRAFAIGVALNMGFIVVEAAYGVIANSLSLLADAGHNLGDVAGLLLA
ncbi:cation transporter, partial [Escherichia coli]